MRPDAGADDLDDAVELQVPPAATYVATLRVLAAGLAARCDLTIDEIEDLQLAVDEACALLLPHADRGAPLVARFHLRPGAIRFDSAVTTTAPAQPDRNGFSWSILEALGEQLEVRAAGTQLSISFGKRRGAPAGAS